MVKEIFSRLLFCFLSALVVSLVYGIANYSTQTSLESRQGAFIFAGALLMISLLFFISALPSFLCLNKNICENTLASLLAFVTLPFFFLILLFTTVLNFTQRDLVLKDFEPVLPGAVFCSMLIWQFYKFRRKRHPEDFR